METVQNEPNVITITISKEQKSQLFDGEEKIQEFESQVDSELNNQRSRKSCKKCACYFLLYISTLVFIIFAEKSQQAEDSYSQEQNQTSFNQTYHESNQREEHFLTVSIVSYLIFGVVLLVICGACGKIKSSLRQICCQN